MTIEELNVVIRANSAQFQSQISSVQKQLAGMNNKIGETSASVSKSSSVMSGALGKIATMAAAAFSVKAMIDFGKQAVTLASDLQEVQNVVDTAFGNMSAQVDEWAKTTVEKFGISELSAKKTASTYMAMSKGMGMYGQAAADMAIQAAERTGDIASFYNMTQEEADTLLKSIWTGETEALKRIGVVMTQANLNAYALAKGIGKTVDEMSQAEQVQLRFQYVMEQTDLAAGDFTKTSASWANQTRVLSERFKELLSILGQGLIQVLTPVIQFLNECVSKLIIMAQQVGTVISAAFGWDTDNQGESAAATEAMANAQNDLADATAKASKEAKKAQSSFDELNVLSTTSSNESTITAGGMPDISNNEKKNATVSSSIDTSNFKKGLEKAKKAFEPFVNKINSAIESINFGKIQENCQRSIVASIPIIKSGFEGLKKIGESSLSAIGSISGGFVSVVGKRIETMTGSIASWMEHDGKKIANSVTKITDRTSKGFENIGRIADVVFGEMGASIDRNRPQTEMAIEMLLSGVSTFALSISEIVTGVFETATEKIALWCEENSEKIGLFFDDMTETSNGIISLFGTMFGDIGDSMSSFWGGTGSRVFGQFVEMIMNIGGTFVDIYHQMIAPIIDGLISTLQDLWDNHLKGLWENIQSFFGSLFDMITTVYNNFLQPIISWIVTVVSPVITNVVNGIWQVIETVFGSISDAIGGIMKSLGGLMDFITGVFSGNWEKAWQGICDFFGGIWDAIWGIVKGFVNLIIDGINLLWSGIYGVVSGLVNGIGEIAGAIGDMLGQDWRFTMPSEPPLIPKLASGGLAHKETVAMIAEGRYDEAVLPLSKDVYSRIGKGIRDSGGATNRDEEVDLLREQNNLLRQLINKDSTVNAIISTSTISDGLQRQNRRAGRTIVPVGV